MAWLEDLAERLIALGHVGGQSGWGISTHNMPPADAKVSEQFVCLRSQPGGEFSEKQGPDERGLQLRVRSKAGELGQAESKIYAIRDALILIGDERVGDTDVRWIETRHGGANHYTDNGKHFFSISFTAALSG